MIQAYHAGIPTAIYRLGYISADSQHGIGNKEDSFHVIISGCLKMKQYPDIDEFPLTPYPVDVAADQIIKLAVSSFANPNSSCRPKLPPTFHFANGVNLSMHNIFQWWKQRDAELVCVPSSSWFETVRKLDASDPLHSMGSVWMEEEKEAESFDWNRQEFDCQATWQILKQIGGAPVPTADDMAELLAKQFETLHQSKFFML
jgi:thioester reductase-like protein